MKKGYQEHLLYKDLAYKIVGCFYNVYNEIGPGFKELIYHNALAAEFNHNEIKFKEESRITVNYRSKKVGTYIPDFVIEDKVLLEIKAVDYMPKFYEDQLYTYLRATKYKLGYLVNFGSNKIDIRRRIYEKARER